MANKNFCSCIDDKNQYIRDMLQQLLFPKNTYQRLIDLEAQELAEELYNDIEHMLCKKHFSM